MKPEPQKAQIKGHGTLTAKFNGVKVEGKILEGINKLNAEHEAKNARLLKALERCHNIFQHGIQHGQIELSPQDNLFVGHDIGEAIKENK